MIVRFLSTLFNYYLHTRTQATSVIPLCFNLPFAGSIVPDYINMSFSDVSIVHCRAANQHMFNDNTLLCMYVCTHRSFNSCELHSTVAKREMSISGKLSKPIRVLVSYVRGMTRQKYACGEAVMVPSLRILLKFYHMPLPL